jgi:effector-binding domain-containing protein
MGKNMAKPKLEDRKEAELAYIEFTGPYNKMPFDEIIPKLYGWAKEQKVMPGFHPMAIFYDDPKAVLPESCRSEIAITFKGPAKETAGIETKHMPAQKVAAISFKGTASEYEKAYQELDKWIEGKGYRVSGPCIEIYSKMPEMIDDVMILYSKIMMPVEAK